jgi:GH25 family lysozyme M1 (1,4-beta-N-acetylmuramidase)
VHIICWKGERKMIKGIDLSTHQKSVNYKKLKEEGIDFAIIRCGYRKRKKAKR